MADPSVEGRDPDTGTEPDAEGADLDTGSPDPSVESLDGVRIVTFDPGHLEGILRLCAAQGWPSLPSDPERAGRALSAPGVTTVVGIWRDAVVGFAQLLSDGEVQAYLALTLVAPDRRGRGIGRALVEAAAQLAGDVRVDVLASPESTGFYECFAHKVMPGYRIYPGVEPRVAKPPPLRSS